MAQMEAMDIMKLILMSLRLTEVARLSRQDKKRTGVAIADCVIDYIYIHSL